MEPTTYFAAVTFVASGQTFKSGQEIDVNDITPGELASLKRTGKIVDSLPTAEEPESTLDSGSTPAGKVVEKKLEIQLTDPIVVLGLEERIVKALNANKVETVNHLLDIDDFTALSGIGDPSAEAIIQKLVDLELIEIDEDETGDDDEPGNENSNENSPSE